MAFMAEAGNFQNKVHVCTGRGEEGLQQSEDKAKGS